MSRKGMRGLAWQSLLFVLIGPFFAGCSARQRFSPDVATALRSEPMRRMEGKSLILY